jgi:DNA ligase D-like protein (predicted 3'-phosphoesterase)
MSKTRVRVNEKRSIFVVQEHHARTFHYDFRLEKAGALKSWAVPKGVPLKKGAKHLAIEVEDHPLDYADFEGVIEEGQYGAGIVTIWDKGTYEVEKSTPNKLVFHLNGNRLKGRYCLLRFKRGGERGWLLCQL